MHGSWGSWVGVHCVGSVFKCSGVKVQNLNWGCGLYSGEGLGIPPGRRYALGWFLGVVLHPHKAMRASMFRNDFADAVSNFVESTIHVEWDLALNPKRMFGVTAGPADTRHRHPLLALQTYP